MMLPKHREEMDNLFIITYAISSCFQRFSIRFANMLWGLFFLILFVWFFLKSVAVLCEYRRTVSANQSGITLKINCFAPGTFGKCKGLCIGYCPNNK